jgi:hypothetical protein
MSNAATNIDQGFSENLRLGASIARVLILVGKRQHDRFITVNAESNISISTLEGVVWWALKPLTALWSYDPATKIPLLSKVAPNAGLQGDLPIGADYKNTKPCEIAALLQALINMRADGETPHLALLIDAALLFEDPGHVRDTEHELLRDIEHFARTQPHNSGKLLILRCANLAAIPPTLSASPAVRVVSIPGAGRDERMAYARLRGRRLAEQAQMDIELLARVIANATDDWRLEDMEGLLRNCEAQGIRVPTELEATARAFRLGVARSPWAGSEIRTAIQQAEQLLEKRVRGQPAALRAICTALRKASAGLSGAHQSGYARGPRATLFFAGPTGTGKTEAAKAIAELVYGDESALVRYDCAEFRLENAVARLIGAPPGYVGYESGGELTDRIRARPHSVVLFDEIEKAHPRLLDIFLSILDDGRLTNGQGVTTDFGECVLIFTSNLGIYEEGIAENGRTVRRPRFEYAADFENIQATVRDAIREEFISVIGRPELLGRLGGEQALIVFDFLRDLSGVAQKFLGNIVARVQRLHGIDLTLVEPGVVEMITAETAARPDALVLGARGMAQLIDNCLTNPLADFIVTQRLVDCPLAARCENGEVSFHSNL